MDHQRHPGQMQLVDVCQLILLPHPGLLIPHRLGQVFCQPVSRQAEVQVLVLHLAGVLLRVHILRHKTQVDQVRIVGALRHGSAHIQDALHPAAVLSHGHHRHAL